MHICKKLVQRHSTCNESGNIGESLTGLCACVHEQTVMRTEIIKGTVEKAEVKKYDCHSPEHITLLHGIVFFEKIIIFQLVKKFPPFCGS